MDLLSFSVLCLLCFVRVYLYVPCGHLLGKGCPYLWMFKLIWYGFSRQNNNRGQTRSIKLFIVYSSQDM